MTGFFFFVFDDFIGKFKWGELVEGMLQRWLTAELVFLRSIDEKLGKNSVKITWNT